MRISILNESTLIKHDALYSIVEALKIQVARDFNEVWHLNPRVQLFSSDDPWWWPIHVIDTEADIPPGALAWHTVDNLNRPYAIIPLKPIIDGGYDIGPTISHELLEMIADPYCNGVVASVWPFGSQNHTYISEEVCDPVEDLFYSITTPHGARVNVSDFVTPTWFLPNGQGPFNFMKSLTHSLELTPGGYTQYEQNGKWVDVFGQATRALRAHYGPHTRRARRQRARLVTAP